MVTFSNLNSVGQTTDWKTRQDFCVTVLGQISLSCEKSVFAFKAFN